MPAITPHVEKHFDAPDAVRDVVIGMADGLTVPFALAAGISGALAQSHIVVTAGIAELAAGGIAMGLGGYLAARTDSEHYDNELKREQDEIVRLPERERAEVVAIFESYGLKGEALERVVDSISAEPARWVEFMMRFELGLEKPDPKRARNAALVIGGSYVIGGLVPLFPYFLLPRATDALIVSAIVTFIALAVFGVVKGHFTGVPPLKAGFQTVLIGGLASVAAFLLARLIS
jgi:vacuolar iron transporter family protein